MKITTTHEIVPLKNSRGDAQLKVQLYLNGVAGQSVVLLSGPQADIEEFVAGKIDDAEIRRRWGFKE